MVRSNDLDCVARSATFRERRKKRGEERIYHERLQPARTHVPERKGEIEEKRKNSRPALLHNAPPCFTVD
jgi:hypothetical protein